MEILRTPESRFEAIPDYNFESHYVQVRDDLRMHYLDEGVRTGPVVLLLHGEPSWSYLYRKMIPILAKYGFRTIAPDLIGFGKSDKPVDQSSYSYQNHVDWLKRFVQTLELNNIILFCQDWGGLAGLRVVADMEDRFSMVVASNTFLPTGQVPVPEVFLKWREFSQRSPDFDIGRVIDKGTSRPLSPEVIEAYNAPFISEDYKAGARIFPMLVPIDADDPESEKNRTAWEKFRRWHKPFLTIFGDKDFIMKGADTVFQKLVPGAAGQDHVTLDAGHFIQEEQGEELARRIIDFYAKNSL